MLCIGNAFCFRGGNQHTVGQFYPGYQPAPLKPKRPFWKKLLLIGGGSIGGLLALMLVFGLILEATGHTSNSKSGATSGADPASSAGATFVTASTTGTSASTMPPRSSTTKSATASKAPKTVARAAVTKPTRSEKPSAALAMLASLPVKGRAPKTGYARAMFGQAWSDDVTVPGGHNGCDTRNDILGRDLNGIIFKAGTRNCVVLTGTLRDPYTNRVILFHRGAGTSNAVQVDHMVALSNAWQTGAQQLSVDQRRNFANDPLNLAAVDGPTNEAKGDGDAATWLPPNKAYRCTYVTRQVQVKAKYHLWVTPPERDAIARILTNCARPVGRVTSQPVPLVTPTPIRPRTTTPTTTKPAPLPVVPVAPSHPVAPPKPAGCTPLSNGGNCYKIGQFCAKRYDGTSGVSADGRRMSCRDNDGWRWEPA